MGDWDDEGTERLSAARTDLSRLRLVVVVGPDRGRFIQLTRGRHTIGKASTCELVLADPAVSGQHLSLEVGPDRIVLRDLGSTNGAWHGGVRFREVDLARGATFTVGKSTLRIEALDAATGLPPSEETQLGKLFAVSDAMRRVFTLIDRVAPTPSTVLIEGETGTGKDLVAQAIHARSPRAAGPFVVCDLGSLSESLAESELFGHVRGSFTGADRDRPGAFETARGGTIFLDEIGELPASIQPRLLRALEQRQVRRVGESTYHDVDVRVIAATNRDLAAEVRAGTFREDLYHRLGIVRVDLPPLRERPDDIPGLIERFVAAAAAAAGREPPTLDEETIRALAAHDWPGNARELRNVVERAVAVGGALDRALDADLLGVTPRPTPAMAADPRVPFHDSKSRLVDAWEHDYVAALLEACHGNVSLASRRAGLDRAYLHRLIKKHRLAP